MNTQDIKVNNQRFISVTMKDDVASLDEVVVVGYGTQKRGSITAAISTVSDKELLKAPTMSISNVVGARIAGVAAVQSSGQPGSDNATLTMRGQTGIVYVIDGIRRTSADFNGLDPNEIESVSILKDASAVAVYGLDANGVFIVTTKQGKAEKMSITYTGSVGFSQNAEQQEWLDGPGYAYWYNKARELQGDSQVFTAEMVQKMRDGVDGWGNTNWYDKVYGTGTRTHHNISATGGSDRVRFFASIGYLNEDGNIDNYGYNRLNLRSNIDAKLTKSLTFTLGVSGRIEKRDSPRYSADPNAWHNVPQQIIRALPYVPDTYEYEGKTYNVSTPTASSPVAPVASINESGYSKSNYSYIQSNFSLKYDAPWLKGLSFKFQGAYDLTYNFSKILSNPYEVMIMNLPTEPATIYADGRRMWRVLANVFNNAAKYAMEGSRVYVDLVQTGEEVQLTIKNVSEQPLNISADELTERFIRGDVSRSTEGSGLGLSIAQNLTKLQGGKFELYLDGDLFKVLIRFPVPKETEDVYQEVEQ